MKLIYILLLSLSLQASNYESYMPGELELSEQDSDGYSYVLNSAKIQFKSGFSVKECIISSRTDSSVSIICNGNDSKNIFLKLESVLVSKDKIILNQRYYNWNEINVPDIMKNLK
jgi:hypothetical protein